MAVGFAYLKSYQHVHIFSDGESALKSVLNTREGRMASINTCRILRDWFERHPDNHLHLHYCPGHSGIPENEAVDADVKGAALAFDVGPGPTPTFHSYVKSTIAKYALEAWREKARAAGPKYWGRHLFRHSAFGTLQHTGNFPLKRLSGRPEFVARFVRCITNHAPTGAY